MTREEAIMELKQFSGTTQLKLSANFWTALNMAIEALEMVEEFEKAQIITGGRLNGRTYAYKCGLEDGKRKVLEQQLNDGCVSRQAVVEYIKTSDADLGHDSENEMVVEDIQAFPPVTPTTCIAKVTFDKDDLQELVNEKMKDIVVERKKGKWVINSHGFPQEPTLACSECGFDRDFYIHIRGFDKIKYCPMCGAEMESEE